MVELQADLTTPSCSQDLAVVSIFSFSVRGLKGIQNSQPFDQSYLVVRHSIKGPNGENRSSIIAQKRGIESRLGRRDDSA